MNTILIAFISLLILKYATSTLLDVLNLGYVKRQSEAVPPGFSDFIDLPTYQKSIEYTEAKTRFGLVSDFYDSIILAVVVLSGLLPWLYTSLSATFGFGIWGQALVLFLIAVILGLPGMPFEWWSTFRIEERFGFNKSTQKLWIVDKVKGFRAWVWYRLSATRVIDLPRHECWRPLVGMGLYGFLPVPTGDGGGVSDVYYAFI